MFFYSEQTEQIWSAVTASGGTVSTFIEANSSDPFFGNVSLLMKADGEDNSTTFIDSSNNNLAITPYGNTKISTTQSKYGGSSAYFNGTNSIAWVGQTLESGLSLGTGDFTIEGWVRLNAPVSGDADCIYANYGTTTRAGAHILRIFSSSKVGFYVYPTASDVLMSTTSLQVGNWYHIAISRVSGTTRLFINGVLEASTTVSLNLTSDPAHPATLGNFWQVTGTYAANSWLNGYIDDFRITKGVGRYTANFTPPDAL